MKQFLEIGKIVSLHGIKGQVKIQPWCDSPEFILSAKNLYLKKGEEKLSVTSKNIVKNMVILKLDGIDTPEDAAKFRNSIVYINRNDVTLEENCYFIQDLIGLTVIDTDSQIMYGKIVDVTETGANDVYHIKADDEKMYYIPAIKQVIIKTDLDEQKMFIRPLKGLFDDED